MFLANEVMLVCRATAAPAGRGRSATILGCDSLCSYSSSSTLSLSTAEVAVIDLTPFEKKVRLSVRLVATAVCSVVMETADWANRVQTSAGDVSDELSKKLHSDVSELLTDLNWSYFVSCTHRCKDDEVCYLPTWPHGGREPHIPAEALQCRTIEELQKDSSGL